MKTIAKNEKLGPLETELRKLETVVKEIVNEMQYLKRREARMRDTNGTESLMKRKMWNVCKYNKMSNVLKTESTNERVKWFSLLSLFTLVTLGTWQILYLRRFFKRKRLID